MHVIVVGIGWAGEKHVQAVQVLEKQGRDVHVAALVDTDPEHLAARAQEFNVTNTYTGLASALEAHPDAGAVVLATPHRLHAEQTELAAKGGRHVLVEKPMALTLEAADLMVRSCEDSGATLMVAESMRYQKKMMALRDVIASGRIGQVLSGRINMIGKGRHEYSYPGRRSWLSDPEFGSGMWMLNGIHQMSAARMLFGEVAGIDAREVHSEKFRSELEATVVALIRFKSGAVATATVSAELHGYGRFGDLVVFGAEGTIEAPHRAAVVQVYADSEEPEVIDCSEEIEGAAPPFVRQMEEFISAVDEEREPYTSGTSERASLAVVLAGYESIRRAAPVRPAY